MLSNVSAADLPWMIDDVGEKVTYHHDDQSTEFKAIVDRNGKRPPDSGYEKQLSQLHHEFTFLPSALPGYTPKRDDTIDLNGINYRLNYVFPDDSDVWTVAAR